MLGLVLVGFDAEAFRDPDVVLGLGVGAARTLRTSYLLTMLGSYLLLVPLAVWVWSRLREQRDRASAMTVLVAGLAYLLLGAAGASILAAVWPALIEEVAGGSDPAVARVAFLTATRIAEDGLQGAVQNIAGAAWWLSVGLWLRGLPHRGLAVLTLVLGAASALNALGSLFAAEALTLPGLTLTVLLAPIWSVWLGLTVLRGRLRTNL